MKIRLILPFLLAFSAIAFTASASSSSNVPYQDSQVRFTVITDGTIRLEWQPQGHFTDEPSFVASERDYPQVDYKKKVSRNVVRIETSKMILEYRRGTGRFTADNLTITSAEGITPAFVWHPGMQQKENLKGTIRTLDWMEGDRKVEKNMSFEFTYVEDVPLEDGILARDGWTLIDESSNFLFDDSDWAWVKEREHKECQDWYFMAYGNDYRSALKDFTVFAGKVPLPPRYTFGYWWSRYWTYSDQEMRTLIDRFKAYDIPLDVLVVDMDWHYTDEGRGGWTGWTWNRSLFPHPEKFMKHLKDEGLKVTLNLHPADGFHSYEERYPDLAKGMGLDPSSGQHIEWLNSDKNFMQNMFSKVMHPMQDEGVDFWWLDWQQHLYDRKMPQLNNTWWINYCYFSDMERHGQKRPLLYHRWGGLGNHRYQVGFSGDATISWASLDYQPYFTSTASNVLYGYWSHDIGGHLGSSIDPEMYVRWIQFGGFSPVMRTHSTKHGALNKEPWVFEQKYTEVIRQTVRQRYDMVPYIYTMARKAYDEGLSLCRPLYYDYPQMEQAYEFRNEYMFGDNMLIAPVTKPSDGVYTEIEVWLPEGEWYELHTGTLLEGGRTLRRKFALDEYGVYVKAGSILPFYGSEVENLNNNDEDIYVTVFPGKDGSFDMYEDAGNDKDYATEYAVTQLSSRWDGNVRTITIAPREGSYEGMPQSRDFKVKVMDSLLPESVSVNGETVPVRYLEKDFAFVIDVPQNDCATEKVIRILYADDSPFIADGTAGVARRMANAIEAMKYRYGCDPIDDLAAMTSLNVEVHYSPEKAEEIIGAFKARYRNLPEIISRQHWLSAPDWEWFLNYCAWDKEYAGCQEDKQMSGNPLFPGWYSDPEAVIWDDEYWVFPTASLPFEQQTYMDAFSSPDLVHWTRHESIVDTVKVKWIWQAMWSPAVIEKDGYYYLFICGNDMYADGDGGIGYVRADNPAGPYEDILGKPLLDKIINGAQPIDQYIFKDKDGTYYMYYGGWGHCNVCILNDDFTGFVPFEDGETFKEITPDGYYEGPFMFIKDGKYYFMWSEGTWTRDDYRVAYAIADNPLGPFERVGIILQQDLEVGTGAGHHSMLHEPESDKWYIFYHRHPLGSTDGNNRVVCVDEIHFDENGYIIPVKMTYEGVQSNPLK